MARKVHRVAPVDGFFIQCRVHGNIMRHIGNRHIQPATAITLWRAINGIVEVFGILSVNGDKRQCAQINAMGRIGLRHRFRNCLQLFQHGPGPDVGNFMTAHGHIYFHAWLHVIAEYFDHGAHGLAALSRIGGDFRHYELAVLGSPVLFLGDHDLMAVAAIVRNDNPEARFIVVTPDELP